MIGTLKSLIATALSGAANAVDRVGSRVQSHAFVFFDRLGRELEVAAARAASEDPDDVDLCAGCERPIDPDEDDVTYTEDGRVHKECATPWSDIAADCETCSAHIADAHTDRDGEYVVDHQGMTRVRAREIALNAALAHGIDYREAIAAGGAHASVDVHAWIIDAIMIACEPSHHHDEEG